ncbi:MAG: gamma-glutamyltransferase, partial [Rhodospirillaceae bacterium]|nr:gamma-glutamyltransferase [Rhodospirillaceae bacterium]
MENLTFKRALVVAPLLAALFLSTAWAQDLPEAATGRTAAKSGTAKSYMVVAANPLAAKAGMDILAAGGSAADAAIAVQLVLNLVEPQSSGIGGGAFMLHYDKGANKLLAYDGRETAPKAATPSLF